MTLPHPAATLLPAILASCLLFGGSALADDLPPAPDGAIVIHVSSSTGVDGQDGRSPETAVKSIRRGQALIRNGEGDRLLLRRGDVFDELFGNWNKSGKSPDQPLVIGSYGDGPRPKILANQTVFNIYGGGGLLHDVIISGLHLVAVGRNPDAPNFDPTGPAGNAIRVVKPVHRLTIQDCRFEYFQGNLTLTGSKTGRLNGITVRRCLVLNAWSTGGATSGQGLYADKVDGLTIEDCVFDHNGWNEKVPGAGANLFRHNVYISADTDDVRVRGNVFANGASHGLQMRSGGVCENNLFIDNSIHAILGGEEGVFRHNVVVGGRDIDAKNPRGFGITLASGKGLVEDNLFLHKPRTTGSAITVEHGKWSPASGVHADIRNNVIYDWSGNALEVSDAVASVCFCDNDLQRIGAGRKLVTIKKPVGECKFSGNRYDSREAQRDKWFSLPEGFVAPEKWAEAVKDASRVERVQYRDPEATVPADFLDGVRAEKEGYTAAVVIDRLRVAFGKEPLQSPKQGQAAKTPARSALRGPAYPLRRSTR